MSNKEGSAVVHKLEGFVLGLVVVVAVAAFFGLVVKVAVVAFLAFFRFFLELVLLEPASLFGTEFSFSVLFVCSVGV
jgi:hypothetical protein